MGQQQLLLVILVTIIVGIATVVAINVFGSSAASANEDAVRNDILGIASSAQGWYIKPQMMGGGGNTFDSPRAITFNDFNFSAEGISDDGSIAWNMNGSYQISGAVTDKFTITGVPSSCEGYTVATATTAGSCDSTGDYLVADILSQDIIWAS